nr:immunoglobulin heavy chain junction region [Macaca mulatta]MOX37747.1 immunoglobulin heavy chain junction region [Macaca mulatta]MOX37795.1 immunoglobulin heavy chain junction region [Macaca mulatta]MOX37974.1 immunoglobulin heavy chain junction region [Macaca mulatta]MOX37986.1 immunoglobulin heavy chain junction region [Macaca mulatta]
CIKTVGTWAHGLDSW